jgi:hypothetical protein
MVHDRGFIDVQTGRRRLLIRCVAMALAAIVVQTLLLRSLPRSTSLMMKVPTSELVVPPSGQGWHLGRIHWNLASYAARSELAPLQAYFREFCQGRSGMAAALCLSDVMAAQFPHGAPRHELVDMRYDPVTDLRDHRAGAPGHCVTRAGLISSILLVSGIPARMLQVIAHAGNGHNVLEVWDGNLGWIIVDPTFGGFLTDGHKPIGALAAFRSPQKVKFVSSGRIPRNVPLAQSFYVPGRVEPFDGQLVYPEPWLYTRVGSPVAPWPLRGAFVRVGPFQWTAGPLQYALDCGIVIAVFVATLCAGVLAVSFRRRGRGIPLSLSTSGADRDRPLRSVFARRFWSRQRPSFALRTKDDQESLSEQTLES